MIRILIVDDHQLVRQGIAALLQRAGDIQVVGEARDGRDAIKKVQQLIPDVVLMDIEMPYLDGLAATQALMEGNCASKILILTMRSDEATAARAASCGAAGYLIKDSTREQVIAAIRDVADGKLVASPEVADFYRKGLTPPRSNSAASTSP